MSYIVPGTVCSPKESVEDVHVIYDKGLGNGSWSVATMKWNGTKAVGMRWNGEPNDTGVGTPQSRGNATWFILPDELAEPVMKAVSMLDINRDQVLLDGYRAMAEDQEREAEATEWDEALAGDVLEAR